MGPAARWRVSKPTTALVPWEGDTQLSYQGFSRSVVLKPNVEFSGTLVVDRVVRGRSAANVILTDIDTGLSYTMFGSDFFSYIDKLRSLPPCPDEQEKISAIIASQEES